MASPKLQLTAILVLSLILFACCSRVLVVEPEEESSECSFKGTCKVKADCAKICGDPGNRQSLCVPGLTNDNRCCCLQHDDLLRTLPLPLSGALHSPIHIP